jgi:hypothetical protein
MLLSGAVWDWGVINRRRRVVENVEKEEEKMAIIQIRVPVWLDKICAWPVMLYRLWKYGYTYRRIYLDEGLWTMLDEADYYRFAAFKWYLEGRNGKIYAVRGAKISPGEIKLVRLHREIMEAPEGLLVDHRNGDSLDNRRENLRMATHSQNAANRQKRKNTSSRFNGVSFAKRKSKWQGKICYQGKQIHLGYFDSEVEAARAYDRAAIKYHGEFARLNFPREDYADEINELKKNTDLPKTANET